MDYYRLKMKTLPRVSFAATDRADADMLESIKDNGYGTVRYVNSGYLEIQMSGKEKVCMGSGEFCVIPANIPYKVKIFKNSVVTCFTFFLDEGEESLVEEKSVCFEHFNNVVEVQIEALFIPCFGKLRPSDNSYHQLKQLIGNYDKIGEYVNAKVSCNAFSFFVVLAEESSRNFKRNKGTIKGKTELYCDRIDEYIEKNYFQPITMTSISDLLLMHENYISRIYKQLRGITVMRHLRDVRIEQAKKLLLTDKYTVDQISKMVGFPNTKYFIQTFKQVEQVTPGKYYHSFYGQRLYSYSPPEFVLPEDDSLWEED